MTACNCEELEKSAWTYLEKASTEAVVAFGPCRLEGFVVNSSTDAGSLTLYHGKDAGAGRIIGVFRALTAVSMVQNLLPPLPCPNGIYAVLSSTCTHVTVFWSVI